MCKHWVEWDATFPHLWCFTSKTHLPKVGRAYTVSSPRHLLHRHSAQTHTCFPSLQTCDPDSLGITKIKCGSLIVAPYFTSFLISLWTYGLPTAVELCLSWPFAPWLVLLDRPASSSSPPASASVLSLCLISGLYLPHTSLRWQEASPLTGIKPGFMIRLLKSISAALGRQSQIHETNIYVIIRENWVGRGETDGK